MRLIFLLFIDLAAVVVAAIGALFLRDNLELSAERLSGLGPYLLFSFIAGAIILPLLRTNRGFWRYSTFNDLLRISVAAGLIALSATGVTFAYDRLEGLARAIPILHVLLCVGLMCSLRVIIRLIYGLRSRPVTARAPAAEEQPEPVLVIGVNAVAELFVRSAREFAKNNIRVVGVLGSNHRHRGRVLHGVPVLGLSDDVVAALCQLEMHGIQVKRIVVATTPSKLSQSARDALTAIEDGTGIVIDYFAERLRFAERPQPLPLSPADPQDGRSGPRPLPSLRDLADHACLTKPYWRAKRVFDFGISLVLIVATAPLFIVLAAAVAIDIGIPVLFWQERPGIFGKRLRLYKFRTMRSAHDANGLRIPESERSSRIGQFLRRSRLDELPQLFNILVGDMSFVGPRPLLPIDQSPAYSGRLAVRPGLTGWAQVNGGRDVLAADKAAMDLWYIRNASFRLDSLIAIKTAQMIILGEKTDHSAIIAAWKDASVC